MKKKSLLLIAPLILGALTGCRKTVSYKVYFNLNYDECPEGESYSVEEGKTVAKPTDPKRTGYRFDCWRVGTESTSAEFDFKTSITKETTLYASWVETVTVTFDPQNEGDTWTETVDKGTCVEKPSEDPTYDENVFKCWTDDKTYSTEYDFTTPINTAKTIYAVWTKGVSLQHNATNLVSGNTYTFTAKEVGTVTSTTGYKFLSSDEDKISINTNTGVASIKQSGTVKITVIDSENEKATDTIDVTVVDPPEEEELLKYMSFEEVKDTKETVIGYKVVKSADAGNKDLPETLIIPNIYTAPGSNDALPVLEVGKFTVYVQKGEEWVQEENETVKHIIFSDNVTKIADGAFSGFKTLISVDYGSKLECIGAWSFKDNNIHGDKNGALHIPKTVNSIWNGAFCSSGAPTEGSFNKVIFDDETSLWKIWYQQYETQTIVTLHEKYDPRENPEEAANLLRSFQEAETGNWYNPVWEKVAE